MKIKRIQNRCFYGVYQEEAILERLKHILKKAVISNEDIKVFAENPNLAEIRFFTHIILAPRA